MKLRAQRCEMGEEGRLYAGWLGLNAMNGWVRIATSLCFVFSGQQIFIKSKWKSLVSDSDTVDN